MATGNVPYGILEKMSDELHNKAGHPICTLSNKIQGLFPGFEKFNSMGPVVSVEDNFDLLRIPKDHPSRRKSDTYYWSDNQVLRTHTSAHQVQLLRDGFRQFLVTGNVFRKDEIDATHYPVFHQMEGVRITPKGVDPIDDLKVTVNKILEELFPGSKNHWKADYFPFTEPSFEVEVEIEAISTEVLGHGKLKAEVPVPNTPPLIKRMEVLGCGEIHPEVLQNAGLVGARGWAFGLGLERLAMKLFKVPDIRLFWSKDPRWESQFKPGVISEFKPFSSHPVCYKDITFWVPTAWHKNDFTDLVREIAGDMVESVGELDTFEKDGRMSKCYRIIYRSMDRSLTNEEVDGLQGKIRGEAPKRLGVEIR
jgi:phenylalanyl-tRNA synthetase alpha chain